MSDVKVAVVGLPRSGNRLIQRLLQRHGFVAEVRHYGMQKEFRNGGVDPDFAVWPVRERWAWEKSCAKDAGMLPRPVGHSGELALSFMREHHLDETAFWLAGAGVPILHVRYEDIVSNFVLTGQRVVRFVSEGNIIFKGWGEEIVDGNAKYRDAAAAGAAIERGDGG